ncbi:MAG: tetratricopeptide repeat protein, partial [Pyrinomonadaceae bacterium]
MIGQTISHYRILSQIGEGGMGIVYVAEDLQLGRRVAIKFPHAGGDEKHYRARFLREARAVSSLTHKNIAAVYDYGETTLGQPFIVMEHVVGQTLGDILLATGLSLVRAVEVIEDVGGALAEAHRRGVVHRDIKPSNVLINNRGEVKVLDFGLAKQLDEASDTSSPGQDAREMIETRSDVVIGTPLYLSPEQARGAPVDGRSDLFALGALLYECVAGRPAFSGANVIEIGAQVLHINPPPPSHFNALVPTELDRVVLKALAKKPEERYQSADLMVADLEAARAKLSGADTTRTRRLATGSNFMRSSALMTLSDTLRRPRLSPLTFFIALMTVLALVWAVASWRAPHAHKLSPEAAEAYKRGVEAMRAGAYYKAGRELEEAVRLDDKYALAHARLAESWAEQDYLDHAKDELLVAASLVPERKALPELDALYLEAITATVRRDNAAAVASYEEIARRVPDSAQSYLDLGRAYERNDETQKAIDSYVKATNLEPSDATAFLRLGVLYGRRQDTASALVTFEKAENLYRAARNEEGRAEVLYQRGNMYNVANKLAEARQNLQQSLELSRAGDFQYQRVLTLLALSSVMISDNRQLAEAERYAREAVDFARSNGMFNLTARGLTDLGNVYFSGGDYAKAEDYFKQAIELAERYRVRRMGARAQLSLASVLMSQIRADEAQPLLQQSLAFYEGGGYRREASQARTLLARAMRLRGDYAGALASFETLLRLARQENNTAQAVLSLNDIGRVLALQSKYPEALKYFEESYAVTKSADDGLNMGYCLVNRATSLWHLGRYEDANALLAQAEAVTNQKPGAFKS